MDPLGVSRITRVQGGGLKRNVKYHLFEQFHIFRENFVTLAQAPVTCDPFLKTLSGQNGDSAYVGGTFVSSWLQFRH